MGRLVLRNRRSIQDDEVALLYASNEKLWRFEQRLTQKEAAKKFGVSSWVIAYLETIPASVSWWSYNTIAEVLGWPKYVKGRKLAEWIRYPAKTAKPKIEETRQMRINFEGGEATPTAGLAKWLNSLADTLKSHIKILSSFYECGPERIVIRALEKLIEQNGKVIENEKQRRAAREEFRKANPL